MSDCILNEEECVGRVYSSSYFSNFDAPNNVDFLEQSDGIEANHPQYTKFQYCWQVMRHSIEGESAIRENAIQMDYLQIPPAIDSSELKSKYGYSCGNSAKHHYVNKSHYIEVVPRILDEVEGRIFSKNYKYDGPSRLNAIINTLDSEGLNFEQYIRWCVREVFGVNRFGVLVDWDEENNKPIFKRYVAESIVNWKTDKRGELILVVLEDEVEEEGQLFSHNAVKRRVSFTIEKDADGNDYVVQRTWRDISKGTDSQSEFIEYESPIALSRNGFSVAKIPFIFFGGVRPTAPMLKPLASSALDYFDAHASYRNALWWACNEQPYFKFEAKEGQEAGFITPDGKPIEGEIEILYGSSNPILLLNGDLKFAGVKGIGLEHMYRRLKDIKSEMTGMGARSFNAQTASNIKVQTERMQQKAEGSVIGSLSSSISLGIRRALELASEWSQIEGDITFELNTDYTEDFDLKYMGELIDALDADVLAPREVFEFLKDNSELIPNQKSYEEHKEDLLIGKTESISQPIGLFDDDDEDGEEDILQ